MNQIKKGRSPQITKSFGIFISTLVALIFGQIILAFWLGVIQLAEKLNFPDLLSPLIFLLGIVTTVSSMVFSFKKVSCYFRRNINSIE